MIGLYIAYVLPVFLRWRMGDTFAPGPWTLGRHYRWINPAAIVWVGITFTGPVRAIEFEGAGVQ